ncbi:MAG: OB-fold protein [Candidatus Kryptoniota bacterium]
MDTRKRLFEAVIIASALLFSSCGKTRQLSATAMGLCGAYRSDATTATRVYDNKTIQVEGVVCDRSTGPNTCYVVLSGDLDDNGIDNQVMCNLNETEASKLATIAKYAKVRIAGKIKETRKYAAGESVVMVDCKFIDDSEK